jgi:hypothetical protein
MHPFLDQESILSTYQILNVHWEGAKCLFIRMLNVYLGISLANGLPLLLGRHDFHVSPPMDFIQAIMDALKGEAQVTFGPQRAKKPILLYIFSWIPYMFSDYPNYPM